MANDYEHLSLEDQQALGQTMHRLLSNPELRKTTLGLLKKADPSVSLPEVELDERFEALQTAANDKIASLEEKLAQKELAEQRNKQLASLRERGLDPAEVEKVMVDKRIGDYETAARFMQMERQTATPTPASITPISLPDDAKAIMKNPRQWAVGEASKAISELMARRG